MNDHQRYVCVACKQSDSAFLLDVNPDQQMRICRNCGLIFVSPQWTNAVAANVFSNYAGWPEGISGGASNRTESLKSIAKTIDKRMPDGGKLLDLGCAEGSFFKIMQETSAKWDLHGAEPDPKWHNHDYGTATVKAGVLQDCHFPDNYFDFVTILDAFCYVPEPDKELLEIKRILKPNGYLLLDVPGQSYLKLRGFVGKLASIKHTRAFSAYPFYYSDKSIAALSKKTSLDIVERLPHSGTIQRSNFLYRMTTAYLSLATIVSKLNQSAVNLFPKIIYIFQKRND